MIPSYIRHLHNCILIAMHDYILSILVSALSEHENVHTALDTLSIY